MGNILVSGLTNMETTLNINDFPIDYYPINFPFFGVNSSVSGVGYNVAKALTVLGDNVNFLSIIGKDIIGEIAINTIKKNNISDKYIKKIINETSNSVIIYDNDGRRQIHCDLKDLQEIKYPIELFKEAATGVDIVCLCNINFSRPFLELAKRMGKIIATDVHAISDIEDQFNMDFMKNADILFMSDEWLPCYPEKWVKWIWAKYSPEIIVVGLGNEGLLLAVKGDNFIQRIATVKTRPVINTIGAGDSLFASFIHYYNKTKNPYKSIKNALIFASYKIGEKGGGDGFLTEDKIEEWYKKIY